MLETGKNYTQEITVTAEDTALYYGSGNLEVFATPALVALIENTAVKCLEGLLETNTDTVGIEINVQHIKATAIGQKVGCKVTITDIDGRRIRFNAEAWDEKGKIGQATHDRFIICPEKFMSKLK
jgi:predicted thioesterase